MLPNGYPPNFISEFCGPNFFVTNSMPVPVNTGAASAENLSNRQSQPNLNVMQAMGVVKDELEPHLMGVEASIDSRRYVKATGEELFIRTQRKSTDSVAGSSTNSQRSPLRISTIITNVQRRNVQRTEIMPNRELTIHQLAAQGELLLLENRLRNGNSDSSSTYSECKKQVQSDGSAGGNNLVNEPDSSGLRSIHWAAANGQVGAIDLLLQFGADPVALSDNRETPLHFAATFGHADVCSRLLDTAFRLRSRLSTEFEFNWNEVIDCTDELGNTPLMYAAYADHTACVNVLLECGADVTLVNEYGLTAYEVAAQRGSHAAKAALEKHILNTLTLC